MKHFAHKSNEVISLCIVPRTGDLIQLRGQTLTVHQVILYPDAGHGKTVAHAYVSMQ